MLVEYLSKNLLLEQNYIETVAKTASRRYKSYHINKKNGKGTRRIYHPAGELKAIQRALHNDILSNFPVHNCAKAYYTGCSILNNVQPHKNNKYLLRMDFKNFFESIKKTDIQNYVNENFPKIYSEWGEKDTNVLCDLVCFNKTLTIGSTTSPTITNIICYELDVKLETLCRTKNIVYTRYADDMFFSTNEDSVLFKLPSEVKKVVRSIKCPKLLWLNFEKTVHSSRKRNMSVTGLTITNDRKISIGHGKKRETKSKVYKWTSLSLEEKRSLSGYLSYCKSVEPEFINRLCDKYGASRIVEILQYP